jgi:NAD(P)H-flavin reductase
MCKLQAEIPCEMSEKREETSKEYLAIFGFDFEKRRCFAFACAKM